MPLPQTLDRFRLLLYLPLQESPFRLPLFHHRNRNPFRRLPSGNAMSAGRLKERHHSGSFQIDEDPRFQERMWRIERMGWLGIAGILLAAAAGLFGHGLFSWTTLELKDPVHPEQRTRLDYERFARAHSETQVIISRPAVPQARISSLWLSGDYLNDVEVRRITPDPVTEELESKGVRYSFRPDEGPQRIVFRFKAERGGHFSGTVRLNQGPAATFHQWLFP